MPFEPVQTGGYTRGSAGPVRLALYTRQRPDDKTGQVLDVVIDAATVERLGWTPGASRLLLAEGVGPDAGFLQLRLADQPGVGTAFSKTTAKAHAGGGQLRVGASYLKHARFHPDTVGLTAATHQVFGSTLTVMLDVVLAPDA